MHLYTEKNGLFSWSIKWRSNFIRSEIGGKKTTWCSHELNYTPSNDGLEKCVSDSTSHAISYFLRISKLFLRSKRDLGETQQINFHHNGCTPKLQAMMIVEVCEGLFHQGKIYFTNLINNNIMHEYQQFNTKLTLLTKTLWHKCCKSFPSLYLFTYSW